MTAVPGDPSEQIQGLIAAVPNADWAALDERETGYRRIPSAGKVSHGGDPSTDIAHYAVATEDMLMEGDQAILLSYLDVVIQGICNNLVKTALMHFSPPPMDGICRS